MKRNINRETYRADLEDSLAHLANARVRVELVTTRVEAAGRRRELADLLDPAREELALIERRIVGAQAALRGLWDDLQPAKGEE